MIMIYKLTSIPDISLSKYQNMSVGGDGSIHVAGLGVVGGNRRVKRICR